mmetsp:Transcript_20786/g.57713  ORF Transcript_20786/g.57713 Transcript_20786/m.57713 type:complete len:277 (+) Transcript_20786:250-1080(+)
MQQKGVAGCPTQTVCSGRQNCGYKVGKVVICEVGGVGSLVNFGEAGTRDPLLPKVSVRGRHTLVLCPPHKLNVIAVAADGVRLTLHALPWDLSNVTVKVPQEAGLGIDLPDGSFCELRQQLRVCGGQVWCVVPELLPLDHLQKHPMAANCKGCMPYSPDLEQLGVEAGHGGWGLKAGRGDEHQALHQRGRDRGKLGGNEPPHGGAHHDKPPLLLQHLSTPELHVDKKVIQLLCKQVWGVPDCLPTVAVGCHITGAPPVAVIHQHGLATTSRKQSIC